MRLSRRGALRAAWGLSAAALAAGALAGCGSATEGRMKQVTLFSAIEGRVVKGGAPVAGARLVREWDFAEDGVRGRDETVADGDGRFRFPAVVHGYKPPRFLAQETVIGQLITVHADGGEWRAWAGSKRNFDPGGETPGAPVPLRVAIDLASPPALRGRVYGHATVAGDRPDDVW